LGRDSDLSSGGAFCGCDEGLADVVEAARKTWETLSIAKINAAEDASLLSIVTNKMQRQMKERI
jgi:hypothetical protein